MGAPPNATLYKNMDGQTRIHRFRYHIGCGYVEPDDVVLDLGCGRGYGSFMLANFAKKVIGVDYDERYYKSCSAQYKKKNLEFRKGNLETMKIPKCDVACAFEVIEHLYKPGKFLKKLKKSTKKYIAFSVPIGETLIMVNGDPQVKGDGSHHSVFPTENHIWDLIKDDNWREFVRFRLGVYMVGVAYNNEMFKD
jgi:SAM-dependent methyltransferase